MADDHPFDRDVTEDRLLDGAVKLLQPARGHRAGTDAVLLAAHVTVQEGEHVVDLGSASGAVGLMVAHRWAGARLTFVDREEALVALCRRNIQLNGFEDRAVAVQADVFHLRTEAALRPAEADLVVTNPPFFSEGIGRSSPEPGRRRAHEMRGGTLADWIGAAARLVRPRGRVCLIHRADALAEVLAAMAPRFGSLALTCVHPAPGRPASRVLVSGVRGGRSPMRIEGSLVLHEPESRAAASAETLHPGAGSGRASIDARPGTSQ